MNKTSKICFYLLFGGIALTAHASTYFEQVEGLKKSEDWEKIIELGEQTLIEEKGELSLNQQFAIADQLVSTYFRLGDFDNAKKHAESLIHLGAALNQPELVATSLYKFSAAIRGEASNTTNPELQQQLFSDARNTANQALEICPADRALKAKILFNAGAALCDDPKGNYLKGIAMYEEAVDHFTAVKDEDYRQRTMLRLGKAYLLAGQLSKSHQIVQAFDDLQPEERTKMHMLYLKAQVLIAEKLNEQAEEAALKGKEIAVRLHAKADIQRFDRLIDENHAR